MYTGLLWVDTQGQSMPDVFLNLIEGYLILMNVNEK